LGNQEDAQKLNLNFGNTLPATNNKALLLGKRDDPKTAILPPKVVPKRKLKLGEKRSYWDLSDAVC
jgi:hypothetical protein